jgi:hypothetical protein
MKGKRIIINQDDKFGKLTVIKEVEPRITAKGIKERRVECICDCGNLKNVMISRLKNGLVKSCGCLQKEIIRKINIDTKTKYNVKNNPSYKIWCYMKTRCYNKNNKDYKHYGGRGIIICDRWKNSFENFLNDMGEKPEGYSIDRINVDGNYEPSNCRWATQKEQVNNRRTSK